MMQLGASMIAPAHSRDEKIEASLEHDPEKWMPVSEKIMLKQEDKHQSLIQRSCIWR